MGYPRMSLRLDEWPESDRQAWVRACAATGFLDKAGRAAGWTEKTRIQVGKDYGRFLFWLKAEGYLASAASPGERLTREHLDGYRAHLASTGMAMTSLLSRVRNLRQAVLAMDETADLRLISTLCSKLRARAEPVRRKEFRVVSSATLVDLTLREYDNIVGSGRPLVGRACDRLRDALMMAFLTFRPIRLATFAGLRLGRHLVQEAGGYRLWLDTNEPKEKAAYESFLPEILVPYLEHYIAEIRPKLLHGKASDFVWISMRGTPASESTVYYQICKITRRLVGHEISPHLFRDCVLTTIATEAPKNVRAGARILGHRTLGTGEAHYNFANQQSAQRGWMEILKTKRGSR